MMKANVGLRFVKSRTSAVRAIDGFTLEKIDKSLLLRMTPR
jgi:hypothetical protein